MDGMKIRLKRIKTPKKYFGVEGKSPPSSEDGVLWENESRETKLPVYKNSPISDKTSTVLKVKNTPKTEKCENPNRTPKSTRRESMKRKCADEFVCYNESSSPDENKQKSPCEWSIKKVDDSLPIISQSTTPKRKSFQSAVKKINIVSELEQSPPKNIRKMTEPDTTPLINTPTSRRRSCRRTSIIENLSPIKENTVPDVGTPVRSSRRLSFLRTTPVKENKSPDVNTPRRSSRRMSFINTSPIQEICKIKTPSTRRRSVILSETNLEPECDISDVNLTPRSNRKSGRRTSFRDFDNFTPQKLNMSGVTHTPSTPLEKARYSLHVSAVPGSLPCREKEFANIYNFIENKLYDEIGGCMYISGVPGTGKTATVCQVVKQLSQSHDLPEFQYIQLNGLRLVDPKKAYSHIWRRISGTSDRTSVDQCQRNLEHWFSKCDRKKKCTVLLIDELDMMCTRKQDVVYNLLDWPTRTHSKLIVLAIANTMDMPERLLKGRVTSRLGLTRLTFYPYTHKQLEEIVAARLSGLDAFSSDAVQLVTRKVAAVSGDARRALDICRRATELPLPDQTVNVAHVKQAIEEMSNSNIVKVIKNMSVLEKLFLKSITDECQKTGQDQVEYEKVLEHMYTLSTLDGYKHLPEQHVSLMCDKLKKQNIVFTNDLSWGLLRKISLNISQDDVYYALR